MSDRKLACSLSEVTSVVRLVDMVAKLRLRFLVHAVGAAEEAQHAAGADGRIADLREQRLRAADAGQQRGQLRGRDRAGPRCSWKICCGDALRSSPLTPSSSSASRSMIASSSRTSAVGRVADQLRLAPRMLVERADRLGRRIADGDQPVAGKHEADRRGASGAPRRRREAR